MFSDPLPLITMPFHHQTYTHASDDDAILRRFPAESSYTPLLPHPAPPLQRRHRIPPSIVFLTLGLLLVAGLRYAYDGHDDGPSPAVRGVDQGVSAKTFRPTVGLPVYPWTDKMLAWQRTAFHFQPHKNWMNDPNGPVLYKGWYHLFYQYNPYGAIWGNIVWGHAASKDLINWRHLPFAMVPDQWYDAKGVWTGSATILEDGQLIMLYTGATNESVQVQNLAYPADPSDPLLTDWVKYPGNPVLFPPPGIRHIDFRDPTTAWLTPEGKWRITIGSMVNKTGLALVYDTKDFKTYDLVDGVLHSVPGTGMWECVDFYPVSVAGRDGLDTSAIGPGVKHVVKTSLDDDRNDYYAIGSYDSGSAAWVPDDPEIDVGIGLRYDYGHFYASKTFYDQDKKRRILWGWIIETISEETNLRKGWASLQAIPRTVLYDTKTGANLLQWPVEEVEALRKDKMVFEMKANTGSVMKIDVESTSQVDIMAEFEVDEAAMDRISGSDSSYSCSGAAERGALGPFGLSVLASKDLTEHTPIYFYITKDTQGNFTTLFCADLSRSSEATDVDKDIYGSVVPVLRGEKLSMRILVDHSIVESFAQGGRTCITTRIYPTKAAIGGAKVVLFNNATDANVTASLKIWQMGSAFRQAYSVMHILVVLVVALIL